MTCLYCKGETKPDLTTYFVEVDNRMIIVKNVPCDKCKQCGEIFYNLPVAKQLEKIVDSLETVQTEVSILSYSAKAA